MNTNMTAAQAAQNNNRNDDGTYATKVHAEAPAPDVDETASTVVVSRDDVAAAMNRAADEILERLGADDPTITDSINLVVNASLHWLDHPDDTLEDAVEANYGDDGDTILEDLFG